jgi:predicted PurR-regulated permease PerM
MISTVRFGDITRWVLTAFSVIIGALALWLSRDILMLTLTAVVTAMLITSPVRLFVRIGLQRPLAIILTLILVIIAFAMAAASLLPGLIDQFRQLVQLLTRALNFNTFFIFAPRLDETDLGVLLRRAMQPTTSYTILNSLDFLKNVNLSDLGQQLSQQVITSITSIPSQVFPFVGGIASVLLSLLIVFFMAIYFVADPGTYQRGLISLVPKPYRPRATTVIDKIGDALRRFLQVQIIIMILTGGTTTVALLFMGVPLAGALGTITGLFSFVPNFGPLIALIPILGVVLLNAPAKILVVIAVFYGLQLLINQMIAPLLLGQETDMPPVVIILAQVLAGLFFGFLGLLLSVPLAAIVVVLVREVYIRDILGDREGEEDLARSAGSAAPLQRITGGDPQATVSSQPSG